MNHHKRTVLLKIKVSYYVCLLFFCLLTAYVLDKTIIHGLIAFIIISTFIGISLTCSDKWKL